MSDKTVNNKRVLHVIPYGNLYPPKNGGQLRCFHLMHELAEYFQLDVLCYQSKSSIDEKGYNNKNINFYNPDSIKKNEGVFKYLPKKIGNSLRYRWLTKTLFQPATMEVLEMGHLIKDLSNKNSYDLVIFEHLSAMSLSPLVKKYIPKAKLILDAHNVDHLLINPKTSNIHYKRIKGLESELFMHVDEFWACSTMDKEILEALNDSRLQAKVVPNGVDVGSKSYVEDKAGTIDNILFCGTLDALPNKEGLNWFYNAVWPKVIKEHPNVKLLVVGKGDRTPYNYLESDARVEFIGEVVDVGPYYKKSFIAIVPLLTGSGTRLKILEAMSFGNPIVTTSKGIEGIEFEKDKDVLLADSEEEFFKSIVQILNNPELGHKLRKQANALVRRQYDWKTIVSRLVKESNF